jgi:hypothetical protein
MKVLHFNALTSFPKDKLHQWLIGLDGEHIIPAIVHRYTNGLHRPDLVTLDEDGNSHPLLSNETVAQVFKRLADRPPSQDVVSDTYNVLSSWQSPDLKRPSALGGPGRPESSVQLKRTRKRSAERYDMHIPGIYLA